MSSVRALSLLLASLCPAFGQPVPPKPLAVYILEIETDVKGDFSKAAGQLTSALETAFTNHHAFKVLERRNLSLIVKQNQLEKDLQAVLEGSPLSQRLVRHVQGADGFIYGELKNGADGAVLTLFLTGLNSVRLWEGQASHTLAKWQLSETQKTEAEALAAMAEARLWPADVSGGGVDATGLPTAMPTKIIALDLNNPRLAVPSGVPLLIRISVDSKPGLALDQPVFAATLEDPGPKSPIDAKAEKSESFFEVRIPPLRAGAELDLRLSFEGNLSEHYLEETWGKASQDDALFKEAVSWIVACGGPCPEMGTSGLHYVLKAQARYNGIARLVLSALPKEMWVSVDGREYRRGASLDEINFPATDRQQRVIGNVADYWYKFDERDRRKFIAGLFDLLSGEKARFTYLVSVPVSAGGNEPKRP